MARQKGRVATPYYTPPQTPKAPKLPTGGAHPSNASNQQLSPRRYGLVRPPVNVLASLWKQASKTYKRQFITLASATMLVALILAVSASQALNRANEDLNTIGSGSIPSVDSAQSLAQYMEDIDAKAADYLATGALTEQKPCTIASTNITNEMLTLHDCDNLTIDAELILLNKTLFDATHNVTYPGERTAIERISAGVEDYVADIALMRSDYVQVTNRADLNNLYLHEAYQAYLAATNVLHLNIDRRPPTDSNDAIIFDEAAPPACTLDGRVLSPNDWAMGSIEDNIDCLNNINKAHLDSAYDDTSTFLGGSAWLLGILCLIFCALLLVATVRMLMITHRVINVGLTLALLMGFILSVNIVFLFVGLEGTHVGFRQMVKDDYNSIYTAAQLKRYGTEANADESRWLLAQGFNDLSNTVRWEEDWQQNTATIRDLMENAQNNRTWPEEDAPLSIMHSAWQGYYSIDGLIRVRALDMQNRNRILDAESLRTGNSNSDLVNFLGAVGALSAANRVYYNDTLATTQNALQSYILVSALLFPLIGLSAVWGITSRLKDF